MSKTRTLRMRVRIEIDEDVGSDEVSSIQPYRHVFGRLLPVEPTYIGDLGELVVSNLDTMLNQVRSETVDKAIRLATALVVWKRE